METPTMVVLGASNVARGASEFFAAARTAVGPVHVIGAWGRGRGYCSASRFLVRSLPSIVDCGLWRVLEERSPGDLFALLLDLGNDLLYGSSASAVATAVERCLDRLAEAGTRCDRLLIAMPPLARLRRLREAEFRVAKAVLFPGRPASLEGTLSSLEELVCRLDELAQQRGVLTWTPPKAAYGLDPIHLRRQFRRRLWADLLRRIADLPAGGDSQRAASLVRLPWPRVSAERWGFWGRSFATEQPVCRLDDGSTLSLY